MTKDKMQIIDDLVTHEEFCVLATFDGQEPHTSTMRFVCDHAAMKFYFLSRKSSKKSKNLRTCPHVSVLINKPDRMISLSINGLYSPVKKKQTIEAITKLYLMKHPDMEELAAKEDVELIRILGRTAQLSEGFDDKFTIKLKNS